MSVKLNAGWAGGVLAVVLLIGTALRPGLPSERQVFAAVAPSVALISHPVTLQVFVDGEKVREVSGDVVFSATVVKSDQTGSYLVTVAHGVDLAYLEEELNAAEPRLSFRVGFRIDADVRDLLSMAREFRSHETGRDVTFKLIWGKEMRADFQWEQVFKIPVRVILVDPHQTGMDLALLHVPTKNLPAVPFGDSRALSTGDTVLDFGNPLGVFGVPQRGIVAVPQERTYEAPAWRRLYTFSMPSFSGMSGSAVLNARGQVVAILKGGSGENFTLGVPSHVVSDWLRGNGFELR